MTVAQPAQTQRTRPRIWWRRPNARDEATRPKVVASRPRKKSSSEAALATPRTTMAPSPACRMPGRRSAWSARAQPQRRTNWRVALIVATASSDAAGDARDMTDAGELSGSQASAPIGLCPRASAAPIATSESTP